MFIKLKPAIMKTINQIKPFIKKKANPPTKIYLPHLLFDNKFLSLVIILKKFVNLTMTLDPT